MMRGSQDVGAVDPRNQGVVRCEEKAKGSEVKGVSSTINTASVELLNELINMIGPSGGYQGSQ
jgi:DNA uptake protein ComE-like DNA-binding protein